jgi:uncharacterized membrane-anchored protein
MLQKLKMIKRKWLYLGSVILVLILTTGIVGMIAHHHFEKRYQGYKEFNEY